MPLEALQPYYNGVFSATVAMKGRLAKLGPEGRKAMEMVSHYQKMVAEFRDALQKTAEMDRSE